MRYFVDDLEAVEPDELDRTVEGIRITTVPNDRGFSSATVEGPTREAVLDYVRSQWGDDDQDWFQTWVVDRILTCDDPPPPPASVAPRDHEAEILCHVNITLPVGSTASAEQIERLIDGALEVGLESDDLSDWCEFDVPRGIKVTIALTEEIS